MQSRAEKTIKQRMKINKARKQGICPKCFSQKQKDKFILCEGCRIKSRYLRK